MRRSISLALALALMLLGQAHAQTAWPAKPIRLIVGFAAGGSTDVTARIITQALSERLGQPVVVENRGGAGGNIGADAVAKADPDGYTLLMATSSTFAANPNLYKTLPFDVQKDFAPITVTAFIPNLLVVNPSVPANNVADFIAYLKANPDKLNFASAGNGTSQHLSLELLEVIQQVRAEKLKALGITTAKRSPLLPDVPTILESLPGYEVALWNGLLAPAKTPPDIIDRINRATIEALRSPEVKAKLAEQGSEPVGNTPAEFKAFIESELVKWRRLVEISGAKVQ